MRDFFTRAIRFSKRADAELALRHEKGVWLTGNLFLREGARFFHAGYSFFGTGGCGAGAPPCKGCLAYGIFFKGRCAPRTGARLLQRSRTQNGKRLASAHACCEEAELRKEKDLQARTLAAIKPNLERKITGQAQALIHIRFQVQHFYEEAHPF